MMIASRLRFVSVNLTRRSPRRESYRPLRGEALLVRLDALYESLAYAVVAVLILVTGIALVQDGHWGWSSTFIWVGMATILAGATLGGIGLKGLAKKRIDMLEVRDTHGVASVERRALPIEFLLTVFVLISVVAMVHKWGA